MTKRELIKLRKRVEADISDYKKEKDKKEYYAGGIDYAEYIRDILEVEIKYYTERK